MSIFDACPPEEGGKLNYFKFERPGDAIEGTFVNLIKDRPSKNPGWPMQDLVGIKIANGEIWYASVKHTNIKMLETVRGLKLGQIIGFKFLENRPSKSGGNDFKLIHLAQDPSIVDQAWLNEQEANRQKIQQQYAAAPSSESDLAQATASQIFPEATPVEVPTLDPTPAPAAPAMTDQQKVVMIAQIIRDKFGITAGEEIKAKVSEVTGLPMVTANLDLIIAKLK